MKALSKEQIAALALEFFGDESFDQKRYVVLTDGQIQEARYRNNVERPSFVGFLIHDLLTTLAVSRLATRRAEVERDEALAQAQQAGEQAGAAQTAFEALYRELASAHEAVLSYTAEENRSYGNWACSLCRPHSEMLRAGFRCARHRAMAFFVAELDGVIAFDAPINIGAEDSAATLTVEDAATEGWSAT